VVVFLADIEFASHDRFDANLVRGIYKMHRTKNIAVVGHGDRGHAEFMNPIDELLDVASAVEQGVIAMQMQVDELGAHSEIGPGTDIRSILTAEENTATPQFSAMYLLQEPRPMNRGELH
jgi:hypothetical protein